MFQSFRRPNLQFDSIRIVWLCVRICVLHTLPNLYHHLNSLRIGDLANYWAFWQFGDLSDNMPWWTFKMWYVVDRSNSVEWIYLVVGFHVCVRFWFDNALMQQFHDYIIFFFWYIWSNDSHSASVFVIICEHYGNCNTATQYLSNTRSLPFA